MTRHDAFEASLFAVFDDDAQAPIPAGQLDRLNAAIASRQPRPARLAGLGGRWIADPASGTSPLGALRVTVPVLRLSAAVLLLLLALALIGAAALIGGRLLEPQPELERLLYGLDGDIYLADANGAHPIRVAEGADLFEESPWAPDGRHFLAFDSTRLTADIREPDGRVVASLANLPGFNGFPVWSPDSTRLQAWTQSYRQIDIYGIDGALQAELPLPEGYTRFRENLGVWAPDGRSVWVLIAGDNGNGEREAWALPIDGSAPQRVADRLAFITFPPDFTRDGTRMAFSGEEDRLFVANADGSDPRSVGWGFLPIWSPSGEQLAYLVWLPGDENRIDLKVVDVATGAARTLVADWQYAAWPPHSWSPDGDRILFSKQGGPQAQDGLVTGSLWTVGVEGGEPTLLVQGATHGAWQPAPATATPTPTPAPAPTDALTTTRAPDALAPGPTITPTPAPPLQVPPSEACALIVKWIHDPNDMGWNSVETVLDQPPLGGPYQVSMDQLIAGRPLAQVVANGERWGSEVRASTTAPDGTQESYGLVTPGGGWHGGLYENGTHVIELSSAQNECSATLVFEVLPGQTPTPASHMIATLDELQRVLDASEDVSPYLGREVAWVGDRVPAGWKDDPAIAAYVDALHDLARVSPTTPAWDEAWASYFATRPALAALVSGLIPMPTPTAATRLQVPPSDACALTVRWIHQSEDIGQAEVATVLDPPPLGRPYLLSMDQDQGETPVAEVSARGERWGPGFDVYQTAPDGTARNDTVFPYADRGFRTGFGQVGTHVVKLWSTGSECTATLVFEVMPGPIPTPAP